MNDSARFVRRNRVDERWAVAIGAVAGLIALQAGAEPTGSPVVDALLVVLSVGAVVWASASAPWWASASAAGVGAAIAFQPVVALIGAVGFVGGLTIGVRRLDQSEQRAVVGAIAMNVLIRSELDGFLGLSAIIGIAVGIGLFVLGLRRRPSAIRRFGWIGTAVAGGVVVVALAMLAAGGLSARPDLTRGSRIANQAIDTLNDGDYQAAAEQFEQASQAFAGADSSLGGLLTVPSRLIPGVAQNVKAGADLAAEAADGTATAATSLRSIDPATLTMTAGRIDLEAIAAVEEPLLQVQDALAGLRSVTESVDSPWLLGAVQDELTELDERLTRQEPSLANAIDAVRLAPQMLGGDGERRYLILFTTPAEARGLGGFTGNQAEIIVRDGAISLGRFGRTSELNLAARGASCAECPQEYVDRYGRTGLTNGPDGAVGPAAWSNITFGAHFPYVAETAQVLYPQSGGEPIDGVFVMDPYVVEALMQYTGPIEVPELGVTVEPDDAAAFILREQYVLAGDLDKETRVDALDTLGRGAIGALLSTSLPGPADLARDLGPLIDERRLLFWTDRPEEQDLLARTRLLGAIPEMGDDGGFSVSFNNTGESKIDAYLARTVDTTVQIADDGTRRLVADVTLTNTAPTTGLPAVVIGNNHGEPDGTSKLFISFYGPTTLETLTRDGEAVLVAPQPEAGWMAYGVDETLRSGETVTYHLEFALPPASEPSAAGPTVWTQPLADRD